MNIIFWGWESENKLPKNFQILSLLLCKCGSSKHAFNIFEREKKEKLQRTLILKD